MFKTMFDSQILCGIIAVIWISLAVIEFIGLGGHIDNTKPESVAKQGMMFTFSSCIATFWIIMTFEPMIPKAHRKLLILFCVLQCIYFIMYFISNQWILDESKISFTDTSNWAKSKLIISILGIVFLVYVFSLAIIDKTKYTINSVVSEKSVDISKSV